MYSALENSPILVNLITQANYTGWQIDGVVASHDSCVPGSVILRNYTLTPGTTYQVSYSVISISGGYVSLVAGTTVGTHRTTSGLYTETITANGPQLSFFSNATCQIQAFNIRINTTDTNPTQENTLVYVAKDRKWLFRTIAPDFGFSLSIDMLTLYHGNLWLHQNGSYDRNTFYGIPYQTIIQFVDNAEPGVPKSFQSLSIQSNQVMITGDNGISTSLGQVSTLSQCDFVKDYLSDGTSNVAVQTIEGVYSAGFLRDANDDLLDGTPLKGNWLQIQLISTENTPLQLFTVNIISKRSAIGSR